MTQTSYLSKQEIAEFAPASPPVNIPHEPTKALRTELERYDWFVPAQLAGRTFAIACVALEVTQRCNLDCTLCYLSDLAETVKDTPLDELERRLDIIHAHYGDYTTIQITGGDPTLRTIEDLEEIVKMVRARNMRPAMFTNGIKASREMLERLSKVGLADIVYHVDMTQERTGYDSEMDLNAIRLEYIERAKGLPLRVLFNTTVFDGNLHEITRLVGFFTDHAARINLASFQLQADTGRGVLRERDVAALSQQTVMDAISEGTGTRALFDMPLIGHPDCNKYTAILTAGNARTPLYDAKGLFGELFERMAKIEGNWAVEDAVISKAMRVCLGAPRLFFSAFYYGLRKIWALRAGLLQGKRPHRISFFIHNFMDESKLEKERCDSCVFMVATADGPLSMCVHNAKRDEMISLPTRDAEGKELWHPLDWAGGTPDNIAKTLPLKKRKGRLRQIAMEERLEKKAS